MQSICYHGRICNELKLVDIDSNGKKTCVLNVRLAVPTPHKTSLGNKTETYFVDCVLWDSGASTVYDNAQKGDQIIFKGVMQNNQYEKDGVKVYRDKFRVNEFVFVEPKRGYEEEDYEERDRNIEDGS